VLDRLKNALISDDGPTAFPQEVIGLNPIRSQPITLVDRLAVNLPAMEWGFEDN
jgi:hypothetical protein